MQRLVPGAPYEPVLASGASGRQIGSLTDSHVKGTRMRSFTSVTILALALAPAAEYILT